MNNDDGMRHKSDDTTFTLWCSAQCKVQQEVKLQITNSIIACHFDHR
jgi:hypothetical protein